VDTPAPIVLTRDAFEYLTSASNIEPRDLSGTSSLSGADARQLPAGEYLSIILDGLRRTSADELQHFNVAQLANNLAAVRILYGDLLSAFDAIREAEEKLVDMLNSGTLLMEAFTWLSLAMVRHNAVVALRRAGDVDRNLDHAEENLRSALAAFSEVTALEVSSRPEGYDFLGSALQRLQESFAANPASPTGSAPTPDARVSVPGTGPASLDNRMSDVEWSEWVEWRLNASPRPIGTTAQRRLGAVEVLFDMLLKATPPAKSDAIAAMVETSAAQGQASGIAHLWLMNAWALDMQRQASGEPRRLECVSVDDTEAVRLAEHGIGLLAMYSTAADAGAVDGISATVSRQILVQPRLQDLSSEEVNNKMAIKDGFLMEGVEAHLLSLDILSLLVDIEAKLGAASRAVSGKRTPTPTAMNPRASRTAPSEVAPAGMSAVGHDRQDSVLQKLEDPPSGSFSSSTRSATPAARAGLPDSGAASSTTWRALKFGFLLIAVVLAIGAILASAS
jgi:hypothetical protein